MRTLLAVALLLIVSLPMGGCRAPRTSTVERPVLAADQVGVAIAIRGMTCPIRCPQEVRAQLLAAPGVLSVIVDPADQSAFCVAVAGTDPTEVVAHLRPPYSGEVLN